MLKRLLAVSLLVLGSAGLVGAAPAPSSSSSRLRDLLDREWRNRLAEDPLFATSVGVHDYDDRLPDASVAAEKRRAAATRAFLDELRGIDRAGLGEGERIDAAIFETQLRDRLAAFEFGEHEI